MADAITFSAQVFKVQTLVDGGLRVTLDLPESALDAVSLLMKCKREGGLLEVAAVPVLVEKPKQWRDQPS